jgi:serine phosphatase RsbU (regulator of sigma subunit)
MNRAGEQFGDERFQTAIAGLAERRADDIVEGILQKVQSFAGKAVQHDDMTIVVVRRTAMTDIEGGVI